MKLHKENGQLSDYGKMIFDEVLKASINKILSFASSTDEVRLLGSLIHNHIGNAVLNKCLKFNQK